MQSSCLMGTEFQFGVMNDGWTMVMWCSNVDVRTATELCIFKWLQR